MQEGTCGSWRVSLRFVFRGLGRSLREGSGLFLESAVNSSLAGPEVLDHPYLYVSCFFALCVADGIQWVL